MSLSLSSLISESGRQEIEGINKRILEHKGEVVFCFRELEVPGEITGDFIPPIPNNYCYYEGGILQEQMKFLKSPSHNSITLQRSFHKNVDYSYMGDFSIPVHRKMAGFVPHYRRFMFDIKDLEKISDGEISIDIHELPRKEFEKYRQTRKIFLSNRDSLLKNFHLLIGDNEARDFLSEKRTKNWEELFDFLKNPETVKTKIDNHYDEERKELAKDVVLLVHEIHKTNDFVRTIERDVLSAHMRYEMEQDGGYFTWGDKGAVVQNYSNAKRTLFKLIPKLNESIQGDGDKITLKSLDEIRGDVLGFPVTISTDEYLKWVTGSLLPEVDERLNKINSYLCEEEKKARSH